MKVVVFTAALALAGGVAVAGPGCGAKNVASTDASSCTWTGAKEVKNVASKDAGSCGYGAAEVKNVANKDADCAASCAAGKTMANAGVEKVDGLGGSGEVAGSCSWSGAAEVKNVANKEADCAASCAAGKTVANAGVEKVNGLGGSGDVASSCSMGASDVKNVANKDAAGCCASGAKNVANADGGCASSCGTAKTVATAAVEKTDGLGGAADGTDSGFIGLGDKVWNFSALHAQSGQMKSLKDVAGDKATVLIFWNQNCPYCVGPSGSWERIAETAKSWEGKGVNIVLIDPGADKSPDAIVKWAESSNVPVLINQDSSIAAKFNATYTPEAFVLNGDHEVVYHGAWDVKRDGTVRTYASDAVLDVLNGQEITVKNARGFGCSIKWAEGAKPQS